MNRTIPSAELAVLLEHHAALTLLDLRRTADFEADALSVHRQLKIIFILNNGLYIYPPGLRGKEHDHAMDHPRAPQD